MAAYFQTKMEIFQKVCKHILVVGQSDLTEAAIKEHNRREQKTSAADQLKRVIAHLDQGKNITANYKWQTHEKTILVGIGILPEALKRIRDGSIDFGLSVPAKKILFGKYNTYPWNEMSVRLQIRAEGVGDSAFEMERSSEELDILTTPTLTTPIRGQVDRRRTQGKRPGPEDS